MQEPQAPETYEDKQRKEEFLKKLQEIIRRRDVPHKSDVLNEQASG